MRTADRWKHLALTVGGLGMLRPAPGTWGSLPPALLVAAMLYAGTDTAVSRSVLLAILAVSCVLCVALGSWGERAYGKKDAGCIVIDEVAGQAIPLLLIGTEASTDGATHKRLAAIAAAFLLFRVCDITKPPPAAGLQKLRGGVGVLVDDLVAGAYAAGLLYGVARWAPSLVSLG